MENNGTVNIPIPITFKKKILPLPLRTSGCSSSTLAYLQPLLTDNPESGVYNFLFHFVGFHFIVTLKIHIHYRKFTMP